MEVKSEMKHKRILFGVLAFTLVAIIVMTVAAQEFDELAFLTLDKSDKAVVFICSTKTSNSIYNFDAQEINPETVQYEYKAPVDPNDPSQGMMYYPIQTEPYKISYADSQMKTWFDRTALDLEGIVGQGYTTRITGELWDGRTFVAYGPALTSAFRPR